MSILLPSRDPLGQAALDFLDTGRDRKILVKSDIADDDSISTAWLFREFSAMPAVEQTALKACRGRVLDVGAGAGSHSLWLQEAGVDVIALDKSHLCCRAMELRDVRQVLNKDIFDAQGSWDTLLFLMNGLGIGGTREGVARLLEHCRSLLAPGGCILFDSTDLSPMYEDLDEEDLLGHAPGELVYTMSFRGCESDPFPWIFLDPATLASMADPLGFRVGILHEEDDTGAWTGVLERKEGA